MLNNKIFKLIKSLKYLYFNRKFLSSGVFYFAHSAESACSFDLTLSSQARNLSHLTNKKFLWNYNLHIPFRRLGVDTNQWLLKIICGCVEIKKSIHFKQIIQSLFILTFEL